MQKAVYKIKSVKATALTDFFLNICPEGKYIIHHTPKAYIIFAEGKYIIVKTPRVFTPLFPWK
jgi:hypothetical protein